MDPSINRREVMKRIALAVLAAIALVMVSQAGLHAYDDIGVVACDVSAETKALFEEISGTLLEEPVHKGHSDARRHLKIPGWAAGE